MEPTRLFDFIYHQQENYPQARAFGGRRDGEWHFYSTEEVIDLANQVSCGLLQLGIQKGDRIAVVVMENRPEWVTRLMERLGIRYRPAPEDMTREELRRTLLTLRSFVEAEGYFYSVVNRLSLDSGRVESLLDQLLADAPPDE